MFYLNAIKLLRIIILNKQTNKQFKNFLKQYYKTDKLQSLELNYPQIPCSCQFQEISQFINIQSTKEDYVFVCDSCAFQEQNSQKFLLIHKIIQSQSNDFFLSWPNLDDKQLFQQIRYFSSYKNLFEQRNQEIETFFNQFGDEFIQALGQLKKAIFNNLNLIYEESSNLLDYYQNISQLVDLKNIIVDKESSKLQKSNKILKIIAKKKKESTDNTNKIKQFIEKINQYPQYNLEILNSLKQTTLSQINSAISEQSNKNENMFQIKQNSNLDNILKLISNQSNFCNQKYLESVKNELLKLQGSINILNIEKDVYLNGKQQINFNQLSLNQIENIEILCNQISKLNNEYDQQKLNQLDQQSLFAKVQPSSNLILDNLDKLEKLECFQRKKYRICQLIKNYPIFEIAQFVNQYPNYIELEISNIHNSKSYSKVSYNHDGNLKLQVINSACCISYLKIKQDCIYKLIIQLSLKEKKFLIGLVGQTHKDNLYISQNSFINSFTPNSSWSYGDKGASKIIKGKCLRDVKYPEEYNQIEITFCVKINCFR
ncbi:hypothetical protein ABPG74_019162 [Tetrahymena malaccensis]